MLLLHVPVFIAVSQSAERHNFVQLCIWLSGSCHHIVPFISWGAQVDIWKPPLWLHRCKMWHLAGGILLIAAPFTVVSEFNIPFVTQHKACHVVLCLPTCTKGFHSEGMLLQQTGKGFLLTLQDTLASWRTHSATASPATSPLDMSGLDDDKDSKSASAASTPNSHWKCYWEFWKVTASTGDNTVIVASVDNFWELICPPLLVSWVYVGGLSMFKRYRSHIEVHHFVYRQAHLNKIQNRTRL